MIDALLVTLGLIMLGLCIYRRFIGSLLLLAGAYVGLLIALISYEEVAYRMDAIGEGALWFEGLVFIVIYLLALIVFFIVSRVAFEDTSIPRLKFFDSLLGALVGVVVGAITMVVVYRGIGYMVSGPWSAQQTPGLVNLYQSSNLGGWLWLGYLRLRLAYSFFYSQGFPPVWAFNYQ
jgi:uncharacterized membrane protein required for colicin V production